jgi:gamma-glutamyltranspeptidase/glutathione hydrolase
LIKKYILAILLLLLFQNSATSTETRTGKGMVVSAQAEASRIGTEILNAGGNAVDAAVGMMFALSVAEPWASGMGGGGIMLVKMRNAATPVIIDYRERAPLTSTPDMLHIESDSITYQTYAGYRSICTPGTIAGAAAAHRKFGRLDIKEVLEPVIQAARAGVTVPEHLTELLFKYYDLIEMNRATSLIFLPDWYPLQPEQIISREDLAVTMEILALRGLDDFYQGRMAVDIAHDIQKNGGLLSMMDLNQYRVVDRAPVQGSYRGYDIYTTAAPASGGTSLVQLMGILDDFNIAQHPFNSGDYIHLITEAFKLVLADRENYTGDPDRASIRTDAFISESHIASLRKRIDVKQATPGNPYISSREESGNASHVSIVDADGNCVALTGTLNFYFGSAVSHPKYGILFNNGLYHFTEVEDDANVLASGKRSDFAMAPTVLMKDGRPVLIIGASGGIRSVAALGHVICALVDYGQDIQSAIEAPRFFYNLGHVRMETRLESEAIDRAKRLGHKVKLTVDYDDYFGIVSGIHIDADSGVITGAADPRGGGSAVGTD